MNRKTEDLKRNLLQYAPVGPPFHNFKQIGFIVYEDHLRKGSITIIFYTFTSTEMIVFSSH